MNALVQSTGGPGVGEAFVLVTDNDAESLVIMAMILQRIGFRARTANCADKALEQVRFASPALVIADWNLRGMTGLALMHRLRDEGPAHDLPVIIMTREFTPAFAQQCGRAGASGCLPKPVQADELYRAVNRFVAPGSRRAEFRVPTCLPAAINDRQLDASASERVTNLSVNGMHVRTRAVHRVDERVRVRLVLHGETVNAEARVVYRQAPGGEPSDAPGMGLHFLSLSPGGAELIRRFIHREVTHGLAPGMSSL